MTSNRIVATFLYAFGILHWNFPGFGGLFFEAQKVTPGEAHIVGAILLAAGVIVWFMQPTPQRT